MTGTVRALRLGTRSSPLALAQSRLVESALRAERPDLRVEIVAIDTRGDRDRLTPLDRVADPDFFSAELDRALLDGRIDFAVHSLKDLDATRPANICTAAIPARENPRDVVLFRHDVEDRLRAGATIRIGSSSTRRRHNVAAFLAAHLPQQHRAPRCEFVPLRGPVDQRVMRIGADASPAEELDGVVLALAGLARLWGDEAGRRKLRPHLGAARWMVLPLSACPTAPAQGALAIECRTDDAQARDALRELHHATTANLVQSELDAVTSLPESTRVATGATAIRHPTLGQLLYTGGPESGTRRVDWARPAAPAESARVRSWDGGAWQRKRERRPIPHELDPGADPAIFVAHWFAASDALLARPDARIWTSGVTSWRRLAARGIWVEGCADNLGFSAITPTLACDVLQLPDLDRWTVLTRRGAEAGWRESGIGNILATYALRDPDPTDIDALRAELGSATDFFWGSIEQFRDVEKLLPVDARHACGAGKTARALRAAGIEMPLVFPSRAEWRAWLR